MFFKIVSRQSNFSTKKPGVYLTWDNWNDFSFLTLFGLMYIDDKNVILEIGEVKIGYFGQVERDRNLALDEEFTELDDRFFSLGQDTTYYENLNSLGEDVRDEILIALKDIAKNEELYNRCIEERVTKISLLRSVAPTSVTGQFRRLSFGGSRLSGFSFNFFIPKNKNNLASEMILNFKVIPESFPPTNIHVLIGRNGVGKTFLLNNMIKSLVELEDVPKNGWFSSDSYKYNERLFANLISITFSAFDESEPLAEKKDKTASIQYSYIGLKRIQTGNEKNLSPKSPTMLKNEFIKSVSACKNGAIGQRWKKALQMLETDPKFKEAEIATIADYETEEEFKEKASQLFSNLSSGHKIVLLTTTRLVETLEERSLVLIDEPEAHLHPPLLSAFIRVISDLLVYKNGVAIIATHSPVILQEVPKSCVWKLRRTGTEAVAERLEIESFGENVGTLTREVFGLEVTDSGFHQLLNDAVNELQDYDQVVRRFDGQLGMDARAIVRTLIASMQSDGF